MKFIDEKIEQYALAHSTKPSSICKELENYTREHEPMARMLIGELEGSLLQTLIHLTRAQNILEIGTFTGYSALVMAEALGPKGKVTTLDITKREYTKSFWMKSKHGEKIEAITGDANEIIKQLSGPYDLIFIDADKSSYLNYLERGLELLSAHGVIVIDNILWSGKVLDESITDADTVALRKVSKWLMSRSDLHVTMLPVRDGVSLVSKKLY
ncbi:MAG: class I SAM-dependent methyltransferase [Bdellovibrio sp.]